MIEVNFNQSSIPQCRKSRFGLPVQANSLDIIEVNFNRSTMIAKREDMTESEFIEKAVELGWTWDRCPLYGSSAASEDGERPPQHERESSDARTGLKEEVK
jgi:hypothetical protein